jgi:uncharacterized membrane protein YkoI
MRNSVTDFNPGKQFSMTTGVAAISIAALLAVVSSFPASAAGDDQSTQALTAKLKESKISLADGIRQAEKQYGLAISAKFELEDGALNLSVYNAKEGRGKDAEHNVLTEAAGDASKSPWAPKLEVFVDKEHLTRSATQLTLVQTSKLGLADAVKKVANRGTVYSVAPAIAGNAVVYEVLVAATDGKSTKFDVDAATGKVAVAR